MKLKKIVKFILLLLPITLFLGSRSEASSLPEISGDNFLTVNMIYKDGKEQAGISGAEIKISKVADIELSPELAIKNISQLKDLNVDWFNLTAEDSKLIAKKISKQLTNLDIKGQVKVTDYSGKVDFSNLQNGIYLVEEVYKTGEALKYSKIEPFFVSLPQNSVGKNGEVTWKKSVNAYPKTEIEKIKDERPKKPKDKTTNKKRKTSKGPKTGDDYRLATYFLATALAGGGLLLVKKRSKAE